MSQVSTLNAPGLYRTTINITSLIPTRVAGDRLVAEFDASATGPPFQVFGIERIALVNEVDDIAAPGALMGLLPTAIDSAAVAVNSLLSGVHGAGSWLGAIGFSVPGDNMGLTPTAIASNAVAVNSLLSGVHGAGSWLGASAQDWTTAERNELRSALGITGIQSTPGGGGQLQEILTDTSSMQPLVDVTISSRAAPGAAMSLVDTAITSASIDVSGIDRIASGTNSVLSGAHGAGAWDAAGGTDPTSIAAEVNSVLSGVHGSGSWLTSTVSIVQQGLEDQGYTSLRAIRIDNLDVLLSTRMTLSEWQARVVDATNSTTIDGTLLDQLHLARLAGTIVRSLDVYSFRGQDGTTEIFRMRDDDPTGRTRLIPNSFSV